MPGPTTRERSTVRKRSVKIAGHLTSISLEDAFYDALREIAAQRRLTVGELLGKIELTRGSNNFSSEIRVFVLDHYKLAANAAK